MRLLPWSSNPISPLFHVNLKLVTWKLVNKKGVVWVYCLSSTKKVFLRLSALNQYDSPIISAAPAIVGTKNSVDPASTLLSSTPGVNTVALTMAIAAVMAAAAAKQAMAKRYFLLYFMYLLTLFIPPAFVMFHY
jgi:hypothetical protein